MTQELTHQKPSANRGAIAPNLRKTPPRASYRERHPASGTLKIPPPPARRAASPAPARGVCCVAGLFLLFGCAPLSIIFCFNFLALKLLPTFNIIVRDSALHHRSWSQTELMSITSNSYGERKEILNFVFDIRDHPTKFKRGVQTEVKVHKTGILRGIFRIRRMGIHRVVSWNRRTVQPATRV